MIVDDILNFQANVFPILSILAMRHGVSVAGTYKMN